MFSSTRPSMSSSASAFGSPLSLGPSIGLPSPFSTPATSSSLFTSASLSSSASAFGSPLSFGPPVGFPSPFSTGANTFSFVTQSFGGKPGSRVTCYTKATELDEKGQRKMLVSISAMPAYKDKSHEELRWEDHHQFNAGGGGVVPSSVQSNDFKNPFATTDSTVPNPITPSVSSNLFPVTVTPPSIGHHSFLNPGPLSNPTVYWGPVPPSVPSNPFATTVTTPSIGQSPFLNPVPLSHPTVYRGPVPPSVRSNPFANLFAMNHVKPNLESVVDKMEEWEKSTQLICKDVKCVQEDMKSWIKRDRCAELEKMEATQTINQLREELAHVTRSKEAIIAEYLASPDFTKRLDEEHEKRLSKIFHPCYVKALGEVQTKFPEMNPFTWQRPARGWFPPSLVTTPF